MRTVIVPIKVCLNPDTARVLEQVVAGNQEPDAPDGYRVRTSRLWSSAYNEDPEAPARAGVCVAIREAGRPHTQYYAVIDGEIYLS